MAHINVKCFGVIRMDSKIASAAVSATRVADIYDRINDLIEADFKIGPGDALVYINGERCRSNKTKLNDNDEVWLLSPASGG